MAATIYDIAQHVGVTTATVSVVLNNKRSRIGVSEATRKRIMQAVEELNYRPSFSAKSLARGRTFSVGLLCRSIENPHFAEVTSILLREASQRGYHLLISLVDYESTAGQEMEMLLQRNVDGIIAWSTQPQGKHYEYVRERQIPMILCQSEYKDLPAIRCDWTPGMREAIAFVKDKGRRRVAYVNQIGSLSKKQGFLTACAELGIEGEVVECSEKPAECQELGRRLAVQSDRPETLMVFSDQAAMGVMSGLYAEGVRVPSDIGVIGLGGAQIGELLNPPLTTIDQAKSQMALMAMTQIEEMIQKKSQATGTTFLPTKLIVRQSA